MGRNWGALLVLSLAACCTTEEEEKHGGETAGPIAAMETAGFEVMLEVSHPHPDCDKKITFGASVTGTVNRLELEVDGAIVATSEGSPLEFTGGPYDDPAHANKMLAFAAIATPPEGEPVRLERKVYIANPKDDPPDTTDGFYPTRRIEETGPNLYRLDRDIVYEHAQEAVFEYAEETNIPPERILTTADLMVEAVAWYVDKYMGWRQEKENKAVFAANDHDPGDVTDFPQPADLTLEISGDPSLGTASARFHGDCEDFAILRAALLRALDFADWAIWHGMNEGWSHEYNIVLYEGAFRIMDYGTIDAHLEKHVDDKYKTWYGWNWSHGPRRAHDDPNHAWIAKFTNNYPGFAAASEWTHETYYRNKSP